MNKLTSKQLAEKITLKLSHNFGVTPQQASDDFFYKAAALVLLDIMRDDKKEFRDLTDKKSRQKPFIISVWNF